MAESGTLLIVDDNPDNLEVLGGILEQAGFKVRPALSGEIALRAIEVDTPDLILLDIRMPGIDGYETCKRLKANERTREIPVIFISAMHEIEDKLTAFRAGGVDYVTKPFQEEEVLARVQAHIELYRIKRHLEERTRALEMANQELESFSYSVSHDLRAPLRAIAGFSRILTDKRNPHLDAEDRDCLERIQAAGQRMSELIDDLLRLAQISRQEMLRTETVDLSALAREIAEALQAQEPERRVEWAFAPQMQVKGDSGLIKVVLQNLIGNAWKYSSKRATARIEVGMTRNDGRQAYFVQDNGAGFDMAHADKLFAPFQRLHSFQQFPGSGIGLATVARIIRRHGGKVWAEGRVEEGSTFYFCMD